MQVGFNSSLVDSQDEGSTEPTSDALEVTFAPEVVENMEMLEREDFAKLNSCCREAWSKASGKNFALIFGFCYVKNGKQQTECCAMFY